MTPAQFQRLESAYKIIAGHQNALHVLENDLLKISKATDLKFFDSGNCEGGVLIPKDSPIFKASVEAIGNLIRGQMREHQRAIDTFPTSYVDDGDRHPKQPEK